MQFAGCNERECDVEGADVWPADIIGPDGKRCVRPPRNIFNSKQAKAAIERGNLYFNRRTRFGKNLAKLIDTAEKYETERQAAIDQSGLSDAASDLYRASCAIESLAYEAAEIEPRTMIGVLIQARALSAYAEAEIEIGHYRGRSGQLVGVALAQSVSRLVAADGKAVA